MTKIQQRLVDLGVATLVNECENDASLSTFDIDRTKLKEVAHLSSYQSSDWTLIGYVLNDTLEHFNMVVSMKFGGNYIQ